eukprot:1158312-Pelagomonas_calceolata.AAC.6
MTGKHSYPLYFVDAFATAPFEDGNSAKEHISLHLLHTIALALESPIQVWFSTLSNGTSSKNDAPASLHPRPFIENTVSPFVKQFQQLLRSSSHSTQAIKLLLYLQMG